MQRHLKNLKDYLGTHTKEDAVLCFDLSMETINRYIRGIKGDERPQESKTNFPSVLILDIETAPITAYVWGLWKQNVNPIQIIDDWFIIGWSAKWLFADRMYTGYVTPNEVKKKDDRRIMKPLWHLMDTADIIVAHNGKKFDESRINTRLFKHGFNPTSPYQVIDTLYYYRRQFSFSSNKLDYLNGQLDIDQKVDTGGFQLWKDCLDGKQEALDKMEEYNINDVRILEENYLRIRPWIKNHPNVGVYMDNDSITCTNCGSTDLMEDGEYVTPVNRYTTYRCKSCGAIAGRSRKSSVNKEDREYILRAQAR